MLLSQNCRSNLRQHHSCMTASYRAVFVSVFNFFSYLLTLDTLGMLFFFIIIFYFVFCLLVSLFSQTWEFEARKSQTLVLQNPRFTWWFFKAASSFLGSECLVEKCLCNQDTVGAVCLQKKDLCRSSLILMDGPHRTERCANSSWRAAAHWKATQDQFRLVLPASSTKSALLNGFMDDVHRLPCTAFLRSKISPWRHSQARKDN